MGLQDFKVMLLLILIAVAVNFLVIVLLAIVSIDFRLWISDQNLEAGRGFRRSPCKGFQLVNQKRED